MSIPTRCAPVGDCIMARTALPSSVKRMTASITRLTASAKAKTTTRLAPKRVPAISTGCAIEAWEVAQAKGIKVEIDDPVAYVRAFGAKIPDSRPSMAQDHAAGRRAEIDAINGAIPRQAAEFRLSVPTNAFVTRVLRARESAF